MRGPSVLQELAIDTVPANTDTNMHTQVALCGAVQHAEALPLCRHDCVVTTKTTTQRAQGCCFVDRGRTRRKKSDFDRQCAMPMDMH
eukprot:m.98387 g.98387  ORF g.98387 m.98387 type:complete len:87 (-) comp16745_c0_seq3:51-311(-)